jgi:nicotinate-nucleotide adenylyltransferase
VPGDAAHGLRRGDCAAKGLTAEAKRAVWHFVCKGEAKVRQGFPPAEAGMVIGLLGGSFDPAHAGHAHITREALKRFGLDRVWWLVSPGNPLKAEGPAPLATRIAQARSVIDDPRVVITGLEVRLGTRHTAALLDRLTALYPGVHFVWLMGADNLVQFHRWDRWQSILARVPVGVLARPGFGIAARQSVAARMFRAAEVPPRGLGLRAPPAWAFVNVPLVDLSSSAIRARGEWRR